MSIVKIVKNEFLGFSVILLMAGISCKRVQEDSKEPSSMAAQKTTVSKAAAREQPQIVLPDPIPVGHARVVLVVAKILPSATGAAAGPCGLKPCAAIGQVKGVLGYGASFSEPLADGQQIELYFPGSGAPEGMKGAITEGTVLSAVLLAPPLGAARYTVTGFEVKAE